MGGEASKAVLHRQEKDKEGGEDSKSREKVSPPPPAEVRAPPSITLVGGESGIYSIEEFNALAKRLPSRTLRRVYTSASDGQSLPRLISCVGSSPNLLFLIADVDGWRFAGYIPDGLVPIAERRRLAMLEKAAKAYASRGGAGGAGAEPSLADYAASRENPPDKLYYGSREAFIDVAAPEAAKGFWPSSGPGANRVYFETDTVPDENNGVGMGGVIGMWAWFLPRGLDKWRGGGRGACTTFGCAGLPATEAAIRCVEVWACGDDAPAAAAAAGEEPKKGVAARLASGKADADRNFLEIATGQKFYSDGA